MKKKYRRKDKDAPLKLGVPGELRVSILSHCIYTERRLNVLGKIFSQHGLSVYDYIRKLRRRQGRY